MKTFYVFDFTINKGEEVIADQDNLLVLLA